ncbi:ribonuclease P protein component [Pandoraea thiooxydans]|uniref:ribonuclease P protein component n=1 Tax=Pandoraea thiooxydans TaxID=445709 RepID=UPI0009F9689B|nr:ribonuclease P protein component [Pandoraea thiooxydans]
MKTSAGFPKAARLLKTDEFSSVFSLRPWRRSLHFVLYMRQREAPGPDGDRARLGVVVGRRHAPHAVTRNLIKRAARDLFRLRQSGLAGWDLVLRLQRRFEPTEFRAASSAALRTACRAELASLFEAAAARAARGTAPAEAGGPPSKSSTPPTRPD